jgi:hypothetical protein
VNFVFAGTAELKTKPPLTSQLPFMLSGIVVVTPVDSSYMALRVMAFIVFE